MPSHKSTNEFNRNALSLVKTLHNYNLDIPIYNVYNMPIVNVYPTSRR
jgi:hypothetical protein